MEIADLNATKSLTINCLLKTKDARLTTFWSYSFYQTFFHRHPDEFGYVVGFELAQQIGAVV